MATITKKVCDVNPDHGEAETVPFGSGSEYFTADLCEADRAKLEAGQEEFVKIGTPVSLRDLAKASNGTSDYDPAVVRAWARQNGEPVNEKGRVPAPLVAKWRKATSQPGA